MSCRKLNTSSSTTVLIDHAAVKAVLQTSNPSGKHARWWTKVYGTGVEDVKIVYRAGRLNQCANALSHFPLVTTQAEGIAENEVQISSLQSKSNKRIPIENFLERASVDFTVSAIGVEQMKDPEVVDIIQFMQTEELPSEGKCAWLIAVS